MFARNPEDYEFLKQELTARKGKRPTSEIW